MEIGKSQFTTDGFVKIYQLWVRQHAKKHIFFQKLGLNTFFGKSVKTERVTGTETYEKREAEI